jgi:hypothetical protein
VATVAVTSGMAAGGCQAKAVAGAARFGSAAEARKQLSDHPTVDRVG